MYIVIDNYDSFTYNLVQYLSELTEKDIKVFRNDEVTVEEIAALNPEGIIISPGPGRPEEAGVSVDVIRSFQGIIPILGVCLGHQAIGYAYGAKIVQARRIVHGKVEDIDLDGKGIFRSIPSPCRFARYHSLAIDPDTMPAELEISARSKDGEIMGVRHVKHMVEGVQFHPESAASDYGKRLLKNFLNYRREPFQVKEVLERVINRMDMSRDEAEGFMEELTEGNLSDARIAGFLVALNAKGVIPEEIAGCAAVLQKKRKAVKSSQPLLDTCGTGGDGMGTYNISSLAALTSSACGAYVAKHGNRAVSSLSGSAEFFTALGINIQLSPAQAGELIRQTGFAFLFAPNFHQAMKYAASTRRELGLKTIMNLLGPLANPAGAEYQVIGVFDEKFCMPVAQAAHILGAKRVMTVHSFDGMDEISVSAPTTAVMIDENGRTNEFTVHPEQLNIKRYSIRDLRGGSAADNARAAMEMLSGAGNPALRDAVMINAGAALYVYGIAESVQDGYEIASTAWKTGTILDKLNEVVRCSNAIVEAPKAVGA